MKILFIGALPPPLHGLSVANAKFVELASPKHQLHIVDAQGASGNPSTVGRFSWRKVIGFLGAYRGVYRIPWCDVVYTTPGQTFFGVLKIAPFVFGARAFGKPVVFHLHGGALGQVYRGLSRFPRIIFRAVVSSYSLAIVLAPSLRSAFTGLLPGTAVTVVPNFADRAWFQIEREYPSQFGENRPLRVLYLSNLIPSKGIISLLDAVLSLVAEGAPVELHVAGHAEVEIAARMKREVDTCSSIYWYGTVSGPQKGNLLESCDILALPTSYPMEGQPICILEAMAAGMSVLTTRHAAIPEIFDGETAFFVSDASVASIRNGLKDAINDPAKVRFFGEQNRKKAMRDYCEESFVNSLLKRLSQVCGEGDEGFD